MRKRNEEFSIKDFLNIFIPKLWLIAVVSIVFGAIFGIYAKYGKDDTYTSTTRIHISKTGDNMDINISDVEFATFYLQTYVELMKVPDFLDKVLDHFRSTDFYYENYEKHGWKNLTAKDISGYISTSTVQDILTVNVRSTDRYLAYGLASSIQYMICQTDVPVLAYSPEIVHAYTIQHPELRTLGEADSHRTGLYTLIGISAGAVLSMGFIFVVQLFDVTIRDKKKLEENFDIPVLGVIPRFNTEEGKAKK